MTSVVRTRIAPSPTGDPHIGTAYVALFNLAYARSQGGQFVLRIEDTDRARSTLAHEQRILDGMQWLGLAWDEGPDVGGPHGPYRQSERGEIYREHADRLLAQGDAFVCFCTAERLDEVRRTQQQAGETTRYDGHCLGLSADEVAQRVAAGEPHVVRMKVPTTGSCTVNDLFRGQIDVPWSQIDMQVLVKTDGMPTYHLAAVVDDHLMAISHVFRGEEWINSAPKHLLLFEKLGWEPPALGHLPLLRNLDKSKLSKRKNHTSVHYFRDIGYLPEAVLNFLGTLGGAMGVGRDGEEASEVFSFADMVARFRLDHMTLGAPVFDIAKLNWLNGQWLRGLTSAEFVDRLVAWKINREYLERLAPLVQARVERLADVAPLSDYLLGDRAALAADAFADLDDATRTLQFLQWRLDDVESWERDLLFETVQSLAEAMGLPMKRFLPPVFLAIGGKPVTLPLFDSMALLGRGLVRARLTDAIAASGGVSKKLGKRLEKEYQALANA